LAVLHIVIHQQLTQRKVFMKSMTRKIQAQQLLSLMPMRKSLLVLSVTMLLSACQKEKEIIRESGKPGPSAPIEAGAAPTSPEGKSSGGGGFVDENSKQLLNSVKQKFAELIKSSSPNIFKVKEGWNRERFASLVENLRLSPEKTNVRHGKEVMFDYGTDETGEYIAAIKPFFLVYGSYPVEFVKEDELKNVELDIRKKILHEIAHLIYDHSKRFNSGSSVEEIETESKAFAKKILQQISKDVIVCEADDLGPYPHLYYQKNYSYRASPDVFKSEIQLKRSTIVIHRSSGLASLAHAGMPMVHDKRTGEPYILSLEIWNSIYKAEDQKQFAEWINSDMSTEKFPGYAFTTNMKELLTYFVPHPNLIAQQGLSGCLLETRSKCSEKMKYMDFNVARSENSLTFTPRLQEDGETLGRPTEDAQVTDESLVVNFDLDGNPSSAILKYDGLEEKVEGEGQSQKREIIPVKKVISLDCKIKPDTN
jgi:hypothetical protein